MNSDPSASRNRAESSGDPRDALIDALLVEHARLGQGDDEAMLKAIRLRTVDQPAPSRVVELVAHDGQAPARRRVSRGEWLKIAAVVAVSLSVLGILLSQSQVGGKSSSDPTRNEQTFQLVSRPHVTVAFPDPTPRTGELLSTARPVGEISLPALPGAGTPEEIVLRAEFSNIATTVSDPVSDELLAEFSISAEKLYALPSDRLVYEGKVVLRHPEFTLEADRLELEASDENTRVGTFLAEGANVTIEKSLPTGETEVAHGTSARWDATNGGSLILAGGPPTLSAGDSFVRPQSSDGYIILRADGYQVIER